MFKQTQNHKNGIETLDIESNGLNQNKEKNDRNYF